jgi:methionyl-tRNA formyltransferase
MEYLLAWKFCNQSSHAIEIVNCSDQLKGGDLLFLISCSEIIRENIKCLYQETMVLHASDLPQGKGWSPYIWELINGATFITVSLIEAHDKVDAGKIWLQEKISIASDLLWDEINKLLFQAELNLIDAAINNWGKLIPKEQSKNIETSYFPKRTPLDSRLDPHKSIADQFNLIRISDPSRYPAFFLHNGKRYKLTIEKIHDE